MRRRLALRTLFAAALVVAGTGSGVACARATTPPIPEDLGAIMLFVDNHSWDDLTIFVLRGMSRERIGRVTAAGRVQLSLDRFVTSDAGQLRVIAEPIGSRNYGPGALAITQILSLEPGQTVLWTIEKDLNRSFVEIR